MTSYVTQLSCARCSRRYDAREPTNLCECGSPLLVEYDLESVGRTLRKEDLNARPPSMWRYSELLAAERPDDVVTLGEGFTPLIRLGSLPDLPSLPDLWVKDDGLNPTGTFKARGAACGVTRARELGIEEVALPTAGNAGGAWACYGAAAGLAVHVAMPQDAPLMSQLECRMYGAELTLVEGSIADAARVIAEGVSEHGWFDVSTLKEPYRLDGKKTLGFELAEQLGWEMPDAVIYPAGGGVGLVGIWRGLLELDAMGWLNGRLPRLIAVQAEGCAPLVKAFEEHKEAADPWKDPWTVAAGLRVPKPLGDFLVLRAIRDTGGTAVAVSDDLIGESMLLLARAGISAAPEGAATFAAVAPLLERGDIALEERVVLINTGTGLKYSAVVRDALASAAIP